jgi:hypothetical protein
MELYCKPKLTGAKKPPEIQIRDDNATKHCAMNKRGWERMWNDWSPLIKRALSTWNNCAQVAGIE